MSEPYRWPDTDMMRMRVVYDWLVSHLASPDDEAWYVGLNDELPVQGVDVEYVTCWGLREWERKK